MAAAAISSFLLPHPTIFCPPPLQFQKRPRKATVRRRMIRRATQTQKQSVRGPLDDIIAEIKCDIRESAPEYTANPSFLDWGNPLKASSTWAVTPLPVSRAPSDRPLTIRKNRNSRSSASGSSMGDPASSSRKASQGETGNTSLSFGTSPWPLLDDAGLLVGANVSSNVPATNHSEHTTAQQSLENAVGRESVNVGTEKQRRPSRLRKFTNPFPRWHRRGTGETSAVDVVDSTLPTTATTTASPDDDPEPSDEAVDAYMRRNAQNAVRIHKLRERMAARLLTAVENEPDLQEDQFSGVGMMPTTLRAAIRMFPEVKVLTRDVQEFSVAVEVEGVLHNRTALSDMAIDIIFVVDNGYYVTEECLKNAIDAIDGALYHLHREDRLALYTTHCTHNTVTGNKPELHYPLQPFGTENEAVFLGLSTSILRRSTQNWKPTRPNPSMTDVVLGVARSLKDRDFKPDRTHIVLLSPAACVLHDVSKTFPDLSIHRINPAALPRHHGPGLQGALCLETCCNNVSVSNWASYQSVPGRVKRILNHARFKKPFGDLTNVLIDLRPRNGCEIIDYPEPADVPKLRLGQVHTIFFRVRVNPSLTQTVDLNSPNPVLNSSLEVGCLRSDLRNAVTLSATKAHLLDVQLYYHNSIHAVDCWNYVETPLIANRELGRLQAPPDNTWELYRRQYFNKFIQLTTEEAQLEAENLFTVLSMDNRAAICVLEPLYQEIKCQAKIRQYEQECRQNLPLCPGPTEIEMSHDWPLDFSKKRRHKRNNGFTTLRGEFPPSSNGMDRFYPG